MKKQAHDPDSRYYGMSKYVVNTNKLVKMKEDPKDGIPGTYSHDKEYENLMGVLNKTIKDLLKNHGGVDPNPADVDDYSRIYGLLLLWIKAFLMKYGFDTENCNFQCRFGKILRTLSTDRCKTFNCIEDIDSFVDGSGK